MTFSLRSVFVFVTAVAIVLSLVLWLHEVGIAISTFCLGIVFACVGAWTKRRRHIVIGSVLMVAAIVSAPWLLTKIHWDGHKKVTVTVRIHDQSGNPIPNATVQLTDSSGSSTASTDSSGIATVVGDFRTCGMDTLFKKTGTIELLGEQLSVSVPGYKKFHRELGEIVAGGCWDLYAPTRPELWIDLMPVPNANGEVATGGTAKAVEQPECFVNA
jgi:hypothetical protein